MDIESSDARNKAKSVISMLQIVVPLSLRSRVASADDLLPIE